MKILHTSDWHLGANLYDFSLIEDQRHFLAGLIDIIKKEDVSAVLISGDIYDRSVPPAWAVELYDYFLSSVTPLGVSVIGAAGNHDSPIRLEFASSLYKKAGYYIFGTVKHEIRPVVLEGKCKINVYPIPFFFPADIRVMLENPAIKTFDSAYKCYIEHIKNDMDMGAVNIAMAHSYFSKLGAGKNTGLITSESEINIGGTDIADAGIFEDFDYTALGHLHTPQWVEKGKVRYSGSPIKYSVSEAGHKKSVTIIDINGKNDIKTEEIYLENLRDLRVISGTFEQLCDGGFHENKSFGDYVFANINGAEELYAMEKLRVLFPNIIGISYKRENTVLSPGTVLEKREARSTRELFMSFYREIKEQDMTPAQVDILDSALLECSKKVREEI